jgi:hypothetical protein
LQLASGANLDDRMNDIDGGRSWIQKTPGAVEKEREIAKSLQERVKGNPWL